MKKAGGIYPQCLFLLTCTPLSCTPLSKVSCNVVLEIIFSLLTGVLAYVERIIKFYINAHSSNRFQAHPGGRSQVRLANMYISVIDFELTLFIYNL